MNIAIVGSRKYANLDQVRKYITTLAPDTCIVSGGAQGVDQAAEEAAQSRGLTTRVFLPEYNRYGRKAPIVRNQEIVEQADKLIAFWDGESRGTKNSIDLAHKKGIPVEIFTL